MISLGKLESNMPANRDVKILENAIHVIRGQRVMLESDIAQMYGVTKREIGFHVRERAPRSGARKKKV